MDDRERNRLVLFVFFSTFSSGFKATRLNWISQNLDRAHVLGFESISRTGYSHTPLIGFLVRLTSRLGLIRETRPFLEKLFFLFSLAFVLKNNRKLKTVVVQPRSITFIRILKLLDIKSVVEISEMSPEVWSSFAPDNKYFRNRMNQSVYLKCVEECDIAYAFSTISRNSFSESYRSKIINIGPLPERQFKGFTSTINFDKIRFLYVGDFSKSKGSDLIIEIIHHTGKEVVHFGHKSDEREVDGLVSYPFAKDILNEIIGLKNVIGLIPSRFEGFSRVYWDYLAAGIPVVGHQEFFDGLPIIDFQEIFRELDVDFRVEKNLYSVQSDIFKNRLIKLL